MRLPGLILLMGSVALMQAPDLAADPLDSLRDRIVRCESRDGQTRECAADTRGGVRLVRQFSEADCIEEETWGRMRGGVWVSRGCRAEFLVARSRSDDGPGEAGFLRCESRDGRSDHCAADTRRGVEITRQLSRTACIRGQNWGWDDRGVWVSGGCRAEFRVRPVERNGEGDDTGRGASASGAAGCEPDSNRAEGVAAGRGCHAGSGTASPPPAERWSRR